MRISRIRSAIYGAFHLLVTRFYLRSLSSSTGTFAKAFTKPCQFFPFPPSHQSYQRQRAKDGSGLWDWGNRVNFKEIVTQVDLSSSYSAEADGGELSFG